MVYGCHLCQYVVKESRVELSNLMFMGIDTPGSMTLLLNLIIPHYTITRYCPLEPVKFTLRMSEETQVGL